MQNGIGSPVTVTARREPGPSLVADGLVLFCLVPFGHAKGLRGEARAASLPRSNEPSDSGAVSGQ
jgi:hypothetical protein